MSWFYIDKNAISKEIQLDFIVDVGEIKGPYIAMKKNENWGLFEFNNGDLKSIIEPQYSEVNIFSENLWPVCKNDKWGFVDIQNNGILPFIWDYVYPFYEEKAAANLNGKWGFINLSGEWVVAPSADYLRSYSNGFTVGSARGAWFILNINYKSILVPNISYLHNFYHNLAAFNIGGIAAHPQLVLGGKWGFINSSGQIQVEARFDWVGHFRDVYAPYYNREKDEWGFIDIKGKETIIPNIDGIREIVDGIATVQKDSEWGFIDIHTGKMVLDYQYKEVKAYTGNGFFVEK